MSEKPVVTGRVDGNAFAIMAVVIRALKMAGQYAAVKEFTKKAMSGDYDNLLAVSLEFVEFDLDEHEEGGYDDGQSATG